MIIDQKAFGMRIRFETDRALFEAFPSARLHIKSEPADVDPLRFLNGLSAKGELRDAVAFCAYLLPRREAVGWACNSVRTLLSDAGMVKSKPFQSAENWVREPSEERRRAAFELVQTGSSDDPALWLAQSAAWSGGNLAPQTPTPVHLTAVAVRIAIILSMRGLKPPEQTARVQRCIQDGARLAETGL
jgi:hypothetical protein